MRKTFLKVSLITCLAIASSAAFTGCKDYDDDINAINERIDQLEKTVNDINEKVKSGCVITSVTPVDGGVKVVLSDNTDFTITNGENGATGTVWTIADGTAGKYTWFCDGKDMGISAQGPQGEQGEQGEQGKPGAPGATSAVVYYVPNAEGTFTEVTIAADGTKTEKDSGISFLAPGTITATVADGYLTLYNVKGAEGPIVISMNGDLRSLVFIPNLYLNGVEGTRYAYAPYKALTFKPNTGSTENESGVTTTILGKSLWVAAPAVSRTIYPVDTMAYELNPSNASIKDLTFSYLNATKEAVSRADAPVAEVKFVGPATELDGNLKVPYNVVNAEAVKDPAQDADAKFSTFALTTTLTDENVITSDYATLVPAARVLRAIAFTKASEKTTDMATNKYDGFVAKDNQDLYWTGDLAVEHKASLQIQYNKGSIDLSKLLEIHYTQKDYADYAGAVDGEDGVMTLADLNAYGLKVSYDMMPYQIGTSETLESQYGKVGAATGIFTPQYVNDNGQSVDCGEEGTETGNVGVSAAGRRPVVRVTVNGTYTNAAGEEVADTVLVGYIKIAIEEEVEEPTTLATVLPEFKNLYVCDFTNSTTWVQWTANVLENTVHMDRAKFQATYTTVDDANIYVKVGDEYVSTIKVNNVDTPVINLYGDIDYNNDANATSTNSVLVWEATSAQIDNIYALPGHTVTIYKKFTSTSGSVLYIGLTTTIADKPTAIYGTQIPTSWYNIADGAKGTNTIHVNDAVPGNQNGNGTTYFAGNINDTWEGNAVNITTQTSGYTFVTKAADVNEAEGKVRPSYSYLFNTTQPVITKGEVKYYLSTDAAQTKLYVSKISAAADATDRVQIAELSNGTAATKDETTNNALIKYVDPTSLDKNSLQLEFINLFAHSETAQANKTYANIDIVTTYGEECKRTVNPFAFHARFLRPVDIVQGDGAEFKDGEANGSSEPIGKFFGLIDWRDKALFSKTTTGLYYATIDNGYNNLYEYYGVKSVSLDLAKVETNQMGDWKLMSAVNKNLELVLKDATGAVVTPVDGVATLSIAVDKATQTTSTSQIMLDVLNKATVTYYNNGTTTAQFSLKIPVTVTYAWGEVTGYVTATVGKTIANAAR